MFKIDSSFPCYVSKRCTFTLDSQSRTKWSQKHEALMESGRGKREMHWDQGPSQYSSSRRPYAASMCISNTFGYLKNPTRFLPETFFFFNAWWMDVKRHSRREQLIPCGSKPLKHPHLFCSLIQNFGFWELIKTKSLRGKWGQGHCNATWLGFS